MSTDCPGSASLRASDWKTLELELLSYSVRSNSNRKKITIIIIIIAMMIIIPIMMPYYSTSCSKSSS